MRFRILLFACALCFLCSACAAPVPQETPLPTQSAAALPTATPLPSPPATPNPDLVTQVESCLSNDSQYDPEDPTKTVSVIRLELYGRNAEDKKLWEYVTPWYPYDGISAQPVAELMRTQDKIYVTEMGTLSVLSVQDGSVLLSNSDFGGSYGNAFTDADGTLYVEDEWVGIALFVMSPEGETLFRLMSDEAFPGYAGSYCIVDLGDWVEIWFAEKDGVTLGAPYKIYVSKDDYRITDDRHALIG